MSTTTDSGTAYAPAADVLGTVLAPGAKPERPSAWSASVTFGWRAMLKIKHVPEQLFDVTAFPLMMTLMFTYLFGGALGGSPTKYLQFLLPGIMVTSVVMITMYTGIEVNKDIEKGVFDRFRTLSIWRPSTLVGYLLGDLLRYTIASVVILMIGLVLGFRPQGGITGVAGGTLLLLGFSFAFSWLWTMLGLLMRSEKALMGVSMLVMMPLTFLSNVYVDPSTMPGWLQPIVNASPITHLVSAVRSLMRGTPDVGEITWVLVSAGVLIAVFGTLTMRLYNRK